MNQKNLKSIMASLVVISCFSLTCETVSASINAHPATNLSHTSLYVHKDKSKGFNVFGEENQKYLSSAQKKDLKELKKCKDNGDKLSDDQQKSLHSIIDCIIKGKLGDKKYEDYKCLITKKSSNSNLNEEENKRLQEYNDIIDGKKLSGKEIFDQFVR